MWQLQRTHRLLNLRQTSRLCTHNERPETMDQKCERIPIFRCRRKPECPEKTMWQILPHTGKESSFLPPEMQTYPSPQGEGVTLASWKCILPQLLPKMQHQPSPQNLLPSICRPLGNDSSLFKLQNPHKSFSPNSFLHLHFFLLFLFIYILIIIIIFLFPLNFLFPFSPKLKILPQSEKIIPQRLRRIIEE